MGGFVGKLYKFLYTKKDINKMNTYYLVDYENVGSNGLVGCNNMTESDHIIIFFTQNARKIDMAEIANHGSAELKMIEIPAGKQSADIHIGSYLGYLVGKSKCNIVIISNDTDFDNVIKFWKKELGISLSRNHQIQITQKQSKVKMSTVSKKESQIRSLFGQHFNKSPYKEKKENIILLLLNSKDKQSLNNELTKLIPSSNIPIIYEVFKVFIKDLPSGSVKPTTKIDKKKREAQFRSVYGQYFKNGVYKEKREIIIDILVNSTTRSQVNNRLCKIIPNENVSKIIKQLQPLLKELP